MKVEIAIYLILASILISIVRVIGGMKNGCFYGKNTKPLPKKLEKYIKNIHFLETPNWYCLFGATFLFSLALFRSLNYSVEFPYILLQFFYSYLVASGSSAIASYHYQGYINIGSSLPFVDSNENPKSEFAFIGISFWWTRPWKGGLRKISMYLGMIELLTGIYLGIFTSYGR